MGADIDLVIAAEGGDMERRDVAVIVVWQHIGIELANADAIGVEVDGVVARRCGQIEVGDVIDRSARRVAAAGVVGQVEVVKPFCVGDIKDDIPASNRVPGDVEIARVAIQIDEFVLPVRVLLRMLKLALLSVPKALKMPMA